MLFIKWVKTMQKIYIASIGFDPKKNFILMNQEYRLKCKAKNSKF